MKLLRYMIWGMFFSLAASYGTLTMVALFNKDLVYTGSEMLEEFLIAIILGCVIGLGTVIFHIERIPLIGQLFLHYIYVTICVLAAGGIGGWYHGPGSAPIWFVLIIELFIYILVWLILFIMTKRDIDEINKKIQTARRERDGEYH